MRRTASRRLAPALHEPDISRAMRRARGVYYTPGDVVRQLVRLTLDRLAECHGGHSLQRCRERPPWRSGRREVLRILDPACGAGAMLTEAQVQLRGKAGIELFGVDLDPAAVAACRTQLLSRDQTWSRSGSAGASPSRPPPAQKVAIDIWHSDALFDDRLSQLAPFDVIVGNPPFVNIRQLAQSQLAAYLGKLRQRFRTARGNFDLYVPFVERAWELLAPGGRCGLVLPNKWATLDYARPLRELLLAETRIEHVVDLSSVRVFAEASVYPHLLVFTKQPPAKSHAVNYQVGEHSTALAQRQLSPAAIAFTAALDVESRVETRPLGELATISCGTPGYSAQRVAAALVEVGRAPVGRNCIPSRTDWKSVLRLPHSNFITSGNIDRYRLSLGNVRFLGRMYERPVLPLDSPALTDRQRRLFAGQKIVIAGLSQRLEAAWDETGLALGVQVFALSEWQVDPLYLLALLNSKLLSYLFRTRYAAKRLAGDYVAINKGQLAQLPIAIPRRTSVSLVQRLGQPGRLSCDDDARIDQWIYRLYRLTKAEIATVEAHFANLGRRAA